VPCWPDIWERIKQDAPWLMVFAGAIGYVALVVVLFWAPKLRRRWLVIASRVLGVAAVVPLVILGPALLFGLLLASGDPPPAYRNVRSQNGQEATVIYQAGFLGRDYTAVTLKVPGCCRHSEIFWHSGPSFLDDMQVVWVDNQHLHLTHHRRSTDPEHCEPRVGDVTITCTSLIWPSQ
jgi:hypothetical protein